MSASIPRHKVIWIGLVICFLGLGSVIGWQVQMALTGAQAHSDDEASEEICPSYNPIGIASWAPVRSLKWFEHQTSLVAKVRVIGHSLVNDQYPLAPDYATTHGTTWVVHELEVLKVLYGEAPTNKTILAGNSTWSCLEKGGTYYLFLSKPTDPAYTGALVDDPAREQIPTPYIIMHPFGQFPVVDGRISVFDGFADKASYLPAQVDGLSEAELEAQLTNEFSSWR